MGQAPLLAWPAIERFTLANGLKVELARRTTVPLVRMLLSFDAGMAADERGRLGIQSMALGLLDEGAAGMTGPQIAELRERLGAGIGAEQSAITSRGECREPLGPSLKQLGGRYAQGFLLSRPLAPEALRDWLMAMPGWRLALAG